MKTNKLFSKHKLAWRAGLKTLAVGWRPPVLYYNIITFIFL